MTDQLRNLLERAVPDDAPTLDPHAVTAAARQGRRRLRAAAAAGAAAAVVVAAGATAALTTRGGDDLVADDARPSPYDAAACPATLPELSEARTRVDSLDGLSSVRMCPDTEGQVDLDALVTDIDRFTADLGAVDDFDPMRCAAISVLNTRQSLQLTYDDGTRVIVPTATCSPISVAGHDIDGQYLGETFLAALDRQRDRHGYDRDLTVPLTCDQASTPSPARPGRERLVAAVACAPKGAATALGDGQLTALDEAWGDPQPTPPFDDDCRLRSDLPHLVTATDRGDVVVIRQQQCGVLTPELGWNGLAGDEGLALPTTLDDLGLTP